MSNISLFLAILRQQKGLCCGNAKSYRDIRSNVVRYRNVTFGQIAVFLLVLLMGFPISSKATTYWDEDFESQLNAGRGGPWDTTMCEVMVPAGSPWADGCNPSRSTKVSHGGSYSLDSDYTAHNPDSNGISIWRAIPDTSAVYTRFWMYLDSDFGCCTAHASNGQSKIFFIRNANYTADVDSDLIVIMLYGINIGLQLEAPGSLGGGANYADGFTLSLNHWYCIETFTDYGTAGNSDGVIKTWIDGNQRLNLSNLALTPARRTNLQNAIGIYAQSADGGHRYIDDFAVGNTRIGCGDPLPSLRPPPNLRVQ